MRFTDTSAIVTAYSPAEPEHARMRSMVLESDEQVLASELARVEFTAAFAAARRAGLILDIRPVVAQFDAQCANGGRIRLLAMEPGTVLARARSLVDEYRLRTLDAIHLAVALESARRVTREPITFITRHRTQAEAARAVGFTVVS